MIVLLRFFKCKLPKSLGILNCKKITLKFKCHLSLFHSVYILNTYHFIYFSYFRKLPVCTIPHPILWSKFEFLIFPKFIPVYLNPLYWFPQLTCFFSILLILFLLSLMAVAPFVLEKSFLKFDYKMSGVVCLNILCCMVTYFWVLFKRITYYGCMAPSPLDQFWKWRCQMISANRNLLSSSRFVHPERTSFQ